MTFNRIDLLFNGFLSKTKSIIVGRINNVQHLQNLDWPALENLDWPALENGHLTELISSFMVSWAKGKE